MKTAIKAAYRLTAYAAAIQLACNGSWWCAATIAVLATVEIAHGMATDAELHDAIRIAMRG